MDDVVKRQERENSLITWAILAAILFWLIEGIVHVFAFQEADLFEHLLFGNWRQMLLRWVFVGLLLGFAVYSQVVIRRIRRITEELRRAKEAAEQANEAKGRFLARMKAKARKLQQLRLDGASANGNKAKK